MKKFLSIVAVLAMVFALAVPTLAAGTPSVTYADDSVKTDTTVVDEDGNTLTVDIAKAEITPKEEETLSAAVTEAAGENATAVEVVKVELKDKDGNIVSDDYFKDGAKLDVVFVRDNTTKEVAAVLYWNEGEQKWDSAEFKDEGGKITATFEHLCTVAFVLKDKDIEPAPGGETGGKTEGTAPVGGKDPSKSPQTGYNALAWAAAAAMLFLGAGFCFVSARKKTNA